jgi:hypothetical protein
MLSQRFRLWRDVISSRPESYQWPLAAARNIFTVMARFSPPWPDFHRHSPIFNVTAIFSPSQIFTVMARPPPSH